MPLINTHTDLSSEARELNFSLSSHTLCMCAAKAQESLHMIYTDRPEPLM